MNRSLGVERTYLLTQYNMLKVSDYISDIPEEVFLNKDIINVIRALQLLDVERVYVKYLAFQDVVNSEGNLEAKLNIIEETRQAMYSELIEKIKQGEK